MYDTVNMWLSSNDIPHSNIIDKISPNLTEITQESYARQTEEAYVRGKLGRYRVIISEKGISLNGSLAKFYFDNNFEILTINNCKEALQMISDVLEVPLTKATISRIDLGGNIITDFNVESYYDFLSDLRYYNRFRQSQSIYYQNGLRKLVFYNKIAEAKNKNVSIPAQFENKNVLRYELRFTKKVKQQLMKNLTAKELYNKEFYNLLLHKWLDNYTKIQKANVIVPNIQSIKNCKDFRDYLMLLGLQSKGLQGILSDIKFLKQNNALKKIEYNSRLKRFVKSLESRNKHTYSSVYVKELDAKVKAIYSASLA